jgi:hypothetical protein
VRWYRRHGYDFLVLSDHDHLTLLDYGSRKPRYKRPLMVPGEEVTSVIQGGAVHVHINGIGITRVIEPIDAGDVTSTIQANVNAILEAGGIASINHPNYQWSFDHRAIKDVVGASLLEVFNGHPTVNVYGGPGKPGNEAIWDGVLTAGRPIFGVATDDSHNYRDFAPDQSNPGRGWVVVRAPELSQDAIVEALASGEFYASTGVVLAELEESPDSIHLRVERRYDEIYTTRFTGRDGLLIQEVPGLEAEYRPRGNEGYVRATVWSSRGVKAWTQPVFLGSR